MILGFTISLIYILLRNRKFLKAPSRILRLLLFFGIGLLSLSYLGFGLTIFTNQHMDLGLISGVFANLGGFALGLAIAQVRRAWWKNCIIWLLGAILLILLFLTLGRIGISVFSRDLRAPFITVIYNSFVGFVVGITIYNWMELPKNVKKVSWRTFIAWLIVGIVLGSIGIAFLYLLIMDRGTFISLSIVIYYLCLYIGIVNGHSDNIIKQAGFPLLLTRRGKNIYPHVNWDRIIPSLIVGILIGISSYLLQFIIALFLNELPNSAIPFISSSISTSIGISLILAGLYGFGPLLLELIEIFSEDTLRMRLGQFGLILALVGILLGEVVHN
jgi:hypothetical protein